MIKIEILDTYYGDMKYKYLDLFNEYEEMNENIGLSSIYEFLPLPYLIKENIVDIDKHKLQEYIQHRTSNGFALEYFISAAIVNYLFFKDRKKYASLLLRLNKGFCKSSKQMNIDIYFDEEERFEALLFDGINKDKLSNDFPEYQI